MKLHSLLRISWLVWFWLIVYVISSKTAFAVAVPTLVQHDDESTTWNYHNTNDIYSMTATQNQPSYAGNIVIVNINIAVPSTPSGLAVTDDATGGTNTYTNLNSIGSSTNGIYVAQFCGVQNYSAQRYTITATTNLGSSWMGVSVSEFNNATCTSDQTWTRDGTTAALTITFSATKAISTSGDLLHMFVWSDNSVTGKEICTPGSQSNITWALLPGSTQTWDQRCQQWGVYASTTALNPSMSWSASSHYIVVCIALKASASATGSAAPTSSLWVVGALHGAVFSNTGSYGPNNYASPIVWQVPTVGNLMVIMATGQYTDYISSISSSVSGETNWTCPSGLLLDSSNGSGYSQICYGYGLSASHTRQLTLTMNAASSTSNITIWFLDVMNAASTSTVYDTGNTTSGDQTTAGAAITYSVGGFAGANEMVFSVLAVNDSGVKVAAQASGVNSLHGNFTMANSPNFNQCGSSIVPPQPYDECNGLFTLLTTGTGSVTITAPEVTDGSAGGAFNEWAASWAAFKPAAGSTVPPGQFPRIAALRELLR